MKHYYIIKRLSGNISKTINVGQYRRGNQKWTIQRNRQDEDKQNKNTTHYVLDSTIRSCGTVALYGPLYIYIFFFADHRATVFTHQKLSKLRQKNLAPHFCHEIGCENDQTYIFRFVRYLSTFFHTYLPINIHFQFIIITNISFVTNPAYFVRHLASPVVSF